MTLVVQNYVTCDAASPDLEKIYTATLESNDGVFGLMNGLMSWSQMHIQSDQSIIEN